ncbi:class 1 fructose-bisphosphatase [soil metagenome]
MTQEVITISRHILEQQLKVPAATGEFSRLLSSLALAAKIISREVNRAGLGEILGAAGYLNVQGEQVTKLDVFAHRVICDLLSRSGRVCIMASEESEAPIEIPDDYPCGKYVVLFDPLDGSANIEINASIGTIFSIHKRITSEGKGTISDCLQKGDRQVCAGYMVYGSSTMLVYTTGQGVHGFTLDPGIGEFLLSHENMQIPAHGKYYSINEGTARHWTAGIANYVNSLKVAETDGLYALRYIGALVADFHRTLLTGGVFLYPANTFFPQGKLRLLYEAAPMALIAEQAGGRGTTGSERILNIQPETLHQRVPLIIGSRDDVSTVERFIHEALSNGSSKAA